MANKHNGSTTAFGLGWALEFMVEGGKVTSNQLSNPGSYYFYREGEFFLHMGDIDETVPWTPRKKKLSWSFRPYDANSAARAEAAAAVAAAEAALTEARNRLAACG